MRYRLNKQTGVRFNTGALVGRSTWILVPTQRSYLQQKPEEGKLKTKNKLHTPKSSAAGMSERELEIEIKGRGIGIKIRWSSDGAHICRALPTVNLPLANRAIYTNPKPSSCETFTYFIPALHLPYTHCRPAASPKPTGLKPDLDLSQNASYRRYSYLISALKHTS